VHKEVTAKPSSGTKIPAGAKPYTLCARLAGIKQFIKRTW